MKCLAVGFLILSLIPASALGQIKNPETKRPTSTSRSNTLRICQGVPIPDGYTIVAYESSPSCKHGAYVLKKDEQPASRPRKVETEPATSSVVLDSPKEISTPYARPP